jgi:Fic family protein
MQLSRSDHSSLRFYSMSAQIRKERNIYYDMLEASQKGSMDITRWLSWFLQCLHRSFDATEETLATVLKKARFYEKHAAAALNERQHKMIRKLLDGFEGKLTSTKWATITKTSQDTALRDIQDLINKNILKQEEGKGRSTSYELCG